MKERQLVTDNVVKAILLNEQFQSVFTPKSPIKLKQLCLQKVQDLQDSGHYSPENVSTDFQNAHRNMKEIHISVNGIIKLLQGLKPDKAPGPHRIKPLLLQKLCLEIAPIMKVIFSRSLDDGSLPPDWFKANVSPVFKKGEKSSPSNYRPISLTCILCKILEHIITSNTVKHFDDNKILYDFQHGFLAKRSCETQPIMLVEELHQNMRAGKQTDVYCLISVKRLIKSIMRSLYTSSMVMA